MAVGVEVESLSFSYGPGRHRLAGVSLQVRDGDLCTLLGPNGAGKTTLLRCILGLLRPLAGSIRLSGQDTKSLSPRELARRVAYVPQASATPFPFTALDMVVMGRTPRLAAAASPSAADRRAARDQLEALGIAHLERRPFPQLSGGERQLTLLARAMVQEAPVLVLDEPTAALDYGNEARFLDLVAGITAQGRAVLMTTHQPGHALTHASRAVLMRSGAVIAEGLPAEVVTARRLSELYGVAVHVAEVPLPGPAGGRQLTCFPLPSHPRPVK